jgi:hypothetical protein
MKTEEFNQIKKDIEYLKRGVSELEGLVKTKGPEALQKSDGDVQKLARKANLSEEKIREIFDFENDTLTLVKIIGKNIKEKIQNISLLTLFGYKYGFNKIEILSQEIRRNVAENGIPLENFATYLKELVPSSVRRKGKAKSPKTSYRLIPSGEFKAKELIKTLSQE